MTSSLPPQGRPGDPAQLFAQAVSLHQRNQTGEAERLYRLVLAADKKHAGALQYLAMIVAQRGSLDEACKLLKRCVEVNPRSAEAHTNLGYALALSKRHADALAAYDAALTIDPDFVPALNNRGISLRELKRFDDAVANYARLLSIRPDFADALYNHGNVLNKMGRFGAALSSLDRALAIKPGDIDTLISRAIALRGLGRLAEAAAILEKVVAVAPNNVLAQVNFGDVLTDLRHFDQAARSYEAALALDPNHPYARSTLAWALASICDWPRLEAMLPDLLTRIAEKRSVLQPFTLLALTDDPAIQLACATDFVADSQPVLPAPLVARSEMAVRDRDRLRIAYVSADFKRHATAYLTTGLFAQHDRSRFAILGIAIGPDDASQERKAMVQAVDEFFDVADKNDHEIARLIAAQGADIVVDLNAHTRGGRFGIFTHRPAPLVVNYLGYPGTTGASFFDYVISDAVIAPEGCEAYFTEKIVRLPDYYAAYRLADGAGAAPPSRSEAGLPEHGFVFCSFNNNYKINRAVFGVWMRLLQNVEASVLWLLGDTPAAEQNLRREAAASGIDPARLVFAGRTGFEQHLSRHRLADLFLDTLPYNAHTTACDALWMGVPLVTCTGQAFAGRVATSLLTSAGLPELATRSLDEYEALALKLAREPALLQRYRDHLTGNRAHLPPFDPDRLRRQMEAAYARMWEIWQRGEAPRSFAVERA